MRKVQNIGNFLYGMFILFIGLLLVLSPEGAYVVVIAFISLALIIKGIATFYYYVTMSRCMVGGKVFLYEAVIFFDLGIFTSAITNIPQIYVFMYLAIIHGFAGLVEILRVSETRKNGAKSWKLKSIQAGINIALAVFCIINMKNTEAAVIIYGFGLISSGFVRIINAFRRNAFVYIQ